MDRRFTLGVLMTLLVAPVLHAQQVADAVSPGFSVTVDSGYWIRISYRGVPIVTGTNFSIAKPDWKGQVFPSSSWRGSRIYRVRRERRGDMRVLTLTGQIKGVASNTITIEAETNRIRIENRYSIAARDDVGYVYTDCFFSKRLLDGVEYEDDAGNTGTLRIAVVKDIPNPDLKGMSLKTKFGALEVEVAQEHTVGEKKGAVGWQFRSVCDRKWGADDRRSFSLMNLFAVKTPTPVTGRSEYIMTFAPSENLAEHLRKERELKEKERDALAAERQKRLTERQTRIAAAGGIVVVPQPQQMERLDGEFVAGPRTRIVVGDKATEVDRRGAERLAEELRDYHRVRVPIVRASEATGATGAIVIGRPGVNARSEAVLASLREQVTADKPGPEGYFLQVRPDSVLVAGSDVRGTWYGVQTLLQLLKRRDSRLVIPCVRIRDWPRFSKRAMMLTIGVREQMPFLRQTLRRVFPRMKLNMVFIGGAGLGRVRWPSHPEIALDRAFTPDDIRELSDLARANFIEPVPHVQGFGHTGKLRVVHPELVCDPKIRRSPCIDITKPEARRFVFEVYADAIDAFRPERYFHVGFDEAKGVDVITRGKDPAQVVGDHITVVNNWLEKRSLRMIMWADMLLDSETFGDSSAANSNKATYGNVNTAPALDRIPKSVVLANWYYSDAEEHKALAYLHGRGFKVFPTTWFRPKNHFNFIRSAHRLGLDWVSGSSWMYCAATNPGMTSLLTGEYAWTPETPTLEGLNYEPTELHATWLKPPRPSGVPCEQTPIDIKGSMNRSYADDVAGDDRGWLDLGAEHDLSAVPSGRQTMAGYLFDIAPTDHCTGCVLVRGPGSNLKGVPTKLAVAIGRRCDSLVFLHTTHYLDYGPRPLGAYVVTYDDGEKQEIPLRNAINVGPWLRARYNRHFGGPRVSGYYLVGERAWVGYTRAAEEVDLIAYEWVNPRPDRKVASVAIALKDRRPELALALFGVTAITER